MKMTTRKTNDADPGPVLFEKTRPENWLSPDIRKKAEKLFKQGHGYKYVAKELAISKHTARDWGRSFKRGKFEPDNINAKSRYHYGEDAKEAVLELRKKGFTYRAIAKETGICISTCRLWVIKSQLAETETD